MFLMKLLLVGVSFLLLLLMVFVDLVLIFDLGGKFDKFFNEVVFGGVECWKVEIGGIYKELEMQFEVQCEQVFCCLVEIGVNFIVMIGFVFGEVLNKVVFDYFDIKFVIIDMVVEQLNV